MGDFIDPRDEGAVGGEDIEMNTIDDDYDVDGNNPITDDQTYVMKEKYRKKNIQDEVKFKNQIDQFKWELMKEDIKFLFEKYSKAGIKSSNKFTDPNNFILKDVGGKKELRLKEYPNVRLLKVDGKPYAINTLFKRIGMDGLRILGFEDSYKVTRPKLPPNKEKTVKTAVEKNSRN